MKRIILLLFFPFISFFAFSDVFQNGEIITESFLENTKYVKIIEDDSNIRYITYDSIIYIRIDEDDIKFITKGISDGDGKENDDFSFDFSKWNIIVDEKSNLIISQKKKK